jgi:hypothetical protein
VVARDQLLADTDPMLPMLHRGQRTPPLLTRWSGYEGRPSRRSYEDLPDMPTDPSVLVMPPAATVLRFAARAAGDLRRSAGGLGARGHGHHARRRSSARTGRLRHVGDSLRCSSTAGATSSPRTTRGSRSR